MNPISWQSDFRENVVKKNRQRVLKLPLALPNSFTLPYVIHVLRVREYQPHSLSGYEAKPCPTAVHMNTPVSTSRSTNPCSQQNVYMTTAEELHQELFDSGICLELQQQTPCRPTHCCTSVDNNDRVSVTRLSAVHFRGWSIRQVSCYTRPLNGC